MTSEAIERERRQQAGNEAMVSIDRWMAFSADYQFCAFFDS